MLGPKASAGRRGQEGRSPEKKARGSGALKTSDTLSSDFGEVESGVPSALVGLDEPPPQGDSRTKQGAEAVAQLPTFTHFHFAALEIEG